MWQVSAVYLPGEMLPGTTTTLDGHIYVAHLFQPKKGCMVKAAWTPCWEVSGPRCLRTIAEKTKRREHKARLVFRMRHKKIGPKQSKESKQSVTKSEQSKKAKQSAMKSEQSKKAKRSDMQSEQSSKKAKLGRAAQTRASDMEGATKALQSFLRPCNIVGGGFARTPTGCVPRFAHACWTRNAQRVA